MANAFAICIEDLSATSEGARFMRCVALVGSQPGLGLGTTGDVLWQTNGLLACGLWVSGDDHLVLMRQEAAAPIRVRRGGRSLDVPVGKPVVILDQDEVEIGTRELRIHIHGTAPAVKPPSLLPAPRSSLRTLTKAAAAAAALGAALGAANCKGNIVEKIIEVREHPPDMEPVQMPDAGVDAAQAKPDALPVRLDDAPKPKHDDPEQQ